MSNDERRRKYQTSYVTGEPNDKDVIIGLASKYGVYKLTGRVPHHIKNLNSALGYAVPPKRGDKGYIEYKRLITTLIGDLHLQLSEIDQ